MLKFTYTETGLFLEHLTQTVEDWMSLRVVLSLRARQRLVVEQCTASFLLPVDLVDLHHLDDEAIVFSPCDAEYIEVNLRGTWVTSSADDAEGVFVTALGDRAESLLFQLWQMAQAYSPSMR